MFNQVISQTPLSTRAADGMLDNIIGSSVLGDVSFLSTLRAILPNRMKEEDVITLVHRARSYGNSQISNSGKQAVFNDLLTSSILSDSNIICLCDINSRNSSDNKAVFDLVRENMQESCPEFYRVSKIEAFYQKFFNVDCYVNTANRSVVILVELLSLKKLHDLQASIPAFLPWYFPVEAGLSGFERDLLMSMRQTTPAEYLKLLGKAAEQYDFRAVDIKQQLKGFESRFDLAECDRFEQDILRYNAQIKDLNDQILTKLRSKDDICIRLLGIKQKIASNSDGTELADYFICNKRLYLESVDRRYITFSVNDYFMFFDRELAEVTINNDNSYIYNTGVNGRLTSEEMKALLSEIFVNETPLLRIKTCAAYRLNLEGTVTALEHHSFPTGITNSMPNPHINEYGCLGNYSSIINTILQNKDYISAIEQCSASCRSLNWGDSTVMTKFINNIKQSRSNDKYIELPDGTMVNAKGAIAWMKETGLIDEKQEEANEQTY